MMDQSSRRPIRARDTQLAVQMARWLQGRGFTPNQISIMSVLFAAWGSGCLVGSIYCPSPWSWGLCILAACWIPIRLLCNLLDGMVAVEGGMKSKEGEIYNELPDRISDVLILVGAGFSTGTEFGRHLGWAASVFSILTAYVRSLGASVGSPHYFCGPMAKPQRMAFVVLGCLTSSLEIVMHWPRRSMVAVLILLILGCVVTLFRRVNRILNHLKTL